MVIPFLTIRQSIVRIAASSVLIGTLYPWSLFGRAQTGSEAAIDLLAEADQLADQSNWYGAGPLYEKAERLFHDAHDTRHELYARIGRLHRDAQSGSYKAVRVEVMKCLADPEVQSDAQLKIRVYALLGNIDLNLNTAAADDDWKQVVAIARASGDAKWENRANGQLGIIAGVNGNIGAAGAALFKSLSRADELGDVSSYVYFSTWLANGMSVHGMADRALTMTTRAIDSAKSKGFAETPIQLSIAKTRSLLMLAEPERSRRMQEAKVLLSATLAQAERDHVLGAQTDLLNMQGQLALEEGNFSAAEKSLTQAIAVAESASLPRVEADALLHLSQFYRNINQAAKADPAISRAIKLQQQTEEGYDLPAFIAEKAEVRAALGSLHEADALYERATTLVEGLLVNAPSSRVKSSMIGAKSEIYLGHFRLAWNRLHNGPEAFRIIETARGRALLDSIRYARQSGPTSESTSAEQEIAHLQSTLLHTRLTSSQTHRVLAQLDDTYDRLFPTEYTRGRNEMTMLKRSPVSVTDLQKQLKPDESFVEYVVDTKASYAMQVTTTGLTIHSLPGRAELSQMAKGFLADVKAKKDASAGARNLYKSLIAPVAGRHSERLILVTDGPLHLIPFGALVNNDGEYLASSLTVSSAPSATVYVTLRTAAARAAAPRPFLGVAYSPVSTGAGRDGSAPVESAPASRGCRISVVVVRRRSCSLGKRWSGPQVHLVQTA